MGKTSAIVKNRWNDKTYDFIRFVVPKGDKETIQAAAEAEGKSLSAYIREAIDEKMNKGGH